MPLPPTLRSMYFALYMAFLSAPDYTQPVTRKPGIITPQRNDSLCYPRALTKPVLHLLMITVLQGSQGTLVTEDMIGLWYLWVQREKTLQPKPCGKLKFAGGKY